MNQPPDWLRDLAIGWGGAFGSAALGRLVAHIFYVSRRGRPFWSWHLLWELPIAFFMALVGRGVADLFGLQGNAELAIIATLSYLGPRELEELLCRYIGRRPPIPGPSAGAGIVGGRLGEIDSQEDRKGSSANSAS
jgi:hypothetical protein